MNEATDMIRTGIRLERKVWEEFGDGCDTLNLVKTRVLSELMERWLDENREVVAAKKAQRKERK
jgi:hypothetical protein